MKSFINGLKNGLGFATSFAVVVAMLLVGETMAERVYAQLQQSGGPGSSVTLLAGSAKIGTVTTDQTTHGTTDLVAADVTKLAGTAIDVNSGNKGNGTQRFVLATDQPNLTTPLNVSMTATPAIATGSNIIGFVRVLPAGCTQTTRFTNDTVGVATGAGTSVSSTTTCVTQAYVNNITNAAVTFRVADKTGTPVIWLGGNADFTIPANSNVGLPMLSGITMTSGITAIAGTAAALNFHVEGYQ
jgi:hypothetical protein